MRRIKVLFVTNWYPTDQDPLCAPWAREHASAVRLYDDVIVLHCPFPEPGLRRLYQIDRRIDRTPGGAIEVDRVSRRSCALPGLSYAIYLWSIWHAYRQIVNRGFRPDVIHAHVYDSGAPALLIGRLQQRPVIVSEHFSSFQRGTLGALDRAKAWVAFRFADRVVTVSRVLQRAIEDQGFRARFHNIPNVVDTRVFFPPPDSGRDPGPARLLFVGRIEPVRRVPCLLEALSLLARRRGDWCADIVGDGSERSACEALARELGLGGRVAFHGRKSKPEVAAFMRRADLFVLPSACETFSVPVAEALACGTPVLATRCGGPEELVSDGVGGLVAPDDPAALCDGLAGMLDRLPLDSRDRIARAASDRFSPERVGGELHALYLSLTSGAGREAGLDGATDDGETHPPCPARSADDALRAAVEEEGG